MKNQKLFEKYKDGSHWEKHPIDYVDRFKSFLLDRDLNLILGSKPRNKIIDLGCGSGGNVFNIRRSPLFEAIGLDINPVIIEQAKKRTEEHDLFFVQNIEQLSFESDTQYAYFCINVMHYVDQKKVLGEIYRTLHPGGYAFIHFNLLIFDSDFTIDYHQKKSDVYDLVKDFKIIKEKLFVRKDKEPYLHTHHVMEVILQKQ